MVLQHPAVDCLNYDYHVIIMIFFVPLLHIPHKLVTFAPNIQIVVTFITYDKGKFIQVPHSGGSIARHNGGG
ncbi:hypothetical protein FACS1894199_01240 [Bacteroidia bacterium]|nr:hypothetical protein FACS1894199_01240 [Bacteroidia bacterium]